MDPIIDFSTDAAKAALPEGLTPELLNSPEVQKIIQVGFNTMYDTRYENDVKGLKDKNASLLSEKKASDEKLKELSDAGVTLDEFNNLKQLNANNGDATERMTKLVEERDEQVRLREESETKSKEKETQLTGQIHTMELVNIAAAGIREHNANNPHLAVESGCEQFFIDKALKDWQRTEDGTHILPREDGRATYGADGNQPMQMSEWVGTHRDVAGYKNMFKQPAGGGAGGGGPGGGHVSGNKADLISGDDKKAAAAMGGMFPELADS